MSDFLKRPLSVQHPKLSIGWFRTNAGHGARAGWLFSGESIYPGGERAALW